MNRPPQPRQRRAVTMIVALAALLAVSLTCGQLLRSLARSHRQARQHQWTLQALWLADSGQARAAARLQADGNYAGETWRPEITESAQRMPPVLGRVEIVVTKDPTNVARRLIRIEAVYPDDPSRRVLQTRELDLLLTSLGESR